MKKIKWSDLDKDGNTAIEEIIASSEYIDEDKERVKRLLIVSKSSYERERQQDSLWKKCEGKEILNAMAGQIGFSNSAALMKAAYVLWSRNRELVSEELAS